MKLLFELLQITEAPEYVVVSYIKNKKHNGYLSRTISQRGKPVKSMDRAAIYTKSEGKKWIKNAEPDKWADSYVLVPYVKKEK
jgi:hypothetical protein